MTTIYCIMITNSSRMQFINRAIKNFLLQKYTSKKLIIVKHSPEKLIQDKDLMISENIHEFYIDKSSQHFTLGGIRNIALQAFVPKFALWTTWDDDDWRRSDYLDTLYKGLKLNDFDIIFIKNRLEYNQNNGFIFKSCFLNGRAFFLAKHIPKKIYDDLDTLEDTHIENTYHKLNQYVGKLDNEAEIYIRVIHTSNTSPFVKPEKKTIDHYPLHNEYQEFDASESEKQYVENTIKLYF